MRKIRSGRAFMKHIQIKLRTAYFKVFEDVRSFHMLCKFIDVISLLKYLIRKCGKSCWVFSSGMIALFNIYLSFSSSSFQVRDYFIFLFLMRRLFALQISCRELKKTNRNANGKEKEVMEERKSPEVFLGMMGNLKAFSVLSIRIFRLFPNLQT